MNAPVDKYLRDAKQWRAEMTALRAIFLDLGLTESLKWGKPCYSYEGRNVFIILPLKNHCALLVCKGALLKDPQRILIKPTENTQAARQIRFVNLQEITGRKAILKKYFAQAIAIEKAGLDVVYKETKDFAVPEELQQRFTRDAAFKSAFAALTPGRQRGYLLYFGAAKQSKTRVSRIEQSADKIFAGKGFQDR